MRTAYLSLILAAGLAGQALAQAPATSVPGPSTPTPAGAAPQAPGAVTSPAPGAAPAAAEAPPALPTTGDGAVILSVLEKVCVPMVRGGNEDQLAKAAGMRFNRRDGTYTMPLGGASRDYTITLLPQGVNKDVCQAEVHYAIGQDEPIVKAINIWSFLHKPELILQANYVAVDSDGVKRVQKSWEHLESSSSTAVNFTTWKKPDGSPLNRGYDTGMLFYQERKF